MRKGLQKQTDLHKQSQSESSQAEDKQKAIIVKGRKKKKKKLLFDSPDINVTQEMAVTLWSISAHRQINFGERAGEKKIRWKWTNFRLREADIFQEENKLRAWEFKRKFSYFSVSLAAEKRADHSSKNQRISMLQ